MGGVAERRFGEGTPLRKNLRSMFSIGGEEAVGVTVGGVDTQVVGEGHNAAAAVAAHHAAGAVGVVELHHEVVGRSFDFALRASLSMTSPD